MAQQFVHKDSKQALRISHRNDDLAVLSHLRTNQLFHINDGDPSPVWLAARGGHSDILETLIKFSPDPEVLWKTAPDGTTPLMMAVSGGHPGAVDILREVTETYGEWAGAAIFGLEKEEQEEKAREMEREEEGWRSSPLVEMSRRFPALNEDVIKRTPVLLQPGSSSHLDLEKDLEPLVLGDFCSVKMFVDWRMREEANKLCQDGARWKEAVMKVVTITIPLERLRPDACPHTCRKTQMCGVVEDLLELCQLLEKALNSDESSLMGKLRPSFHLIGSVADGSRVVDPPDLDITLQFEQFQWYPFTQRSNEKGVRINGALLECLERFAIDGSPDLLDFGKFLAQMLKEVHQGVVRIKQYLPRHNVVNVNLNFRPCAMCESASFDKAESTTTYYPWTHCGSCIPTVTHSKLSPCLIFQWNDGSLEEPIITTVDLIATFPLVAKDVLELYRLVLDTLVVSQPPNWRSYFNKFMQRDIILPEAFAKNKAYYDGNRKFPVALKLFNYGPVDNYIIRPAQKMHVSRFYYCPKLKKVYQYVKVLKEMLKVDVKSYVIKKHLLMRDVIRKAENPEVTIDELLFKVIFTTDLRSLFEKKIDFQAWLVKIREVRGTSDHARIPLFAEDTFT